MVGEESNVELGIETIEKQYIVAGKMKPGHKKPQMTIRKGQWEGGGKWPGRVLVVWF